MNNYHGTEQLRDEHARQKNVLQAVFVAMTVLVTARLLDLVPGQQVVGIIIGVKI